MDKTHIQDVASALFLENVSLQFMIYCNGGKLSKEKAFMNFAILEPPAKVKFRCAVPTYARF